MFVLDATLSSPTEDTLVASQRLLESLLKDSSQPDDGAGILRHYYRPTRILRFNFYLFFLLQLEENSAESSQGERNTPLFLVANKVDLLRLEHNTTSPIVDSLVSSLSHGQKKVDTHCISCTSGAGLQAS